VSIGADRQARHGMPRRGGGGRASNTSRKERESLDG
jgi:hypothetical protein